MLLLYCNMFEISVLVGIAVCSKRKKGKRKSTYYYVAWWYMLWISNMLYVVTYESKICNLRNTNINGNANDKSVKAKWLIAWLQYIFLYVYGRYSIERAAWDHPQIRVQTSFPVCHIYRIGRVFKLFRNLESHAVW